MAVLCLLLLVAVPSISCTSTNVSDTERTARLVHSSEDDVYQGALEVQLNGTWYAICYEYSWDILDIPVACRHLGFTNVSHPVSFSVSEVHPSGISLRGLSCTGIEERLTDCSYHLGFCEDHQIIGIRCEPDRYLHGEVILLNSLQTSDDYQGTVEVNLNGIWHAFCDDTWDLNDAIVVCRQLGYVGVSHQVQLVGIRSLSLKYVTDLVCTGREDRITDCSFNLAECGENEDVAIACKEDKVLIEDIRLVGGAGPSEGRVEVSLDGVWGTVCDHDWDVTDAAVVCRQLGFRGALQASVQSSFGEGSGPIFLDDVNCTGAESQLEECGHRGLGSHDCHHGQDAGVVCDNVTVFIQNVRLVGGRVQEGRLEVYMSNEWGTACLTGWDLNDATVVCHQLGFLGALEVYGPERFGQGSGRIWLHSVNCTGNETELEECARGRIDGYQCDHRSDVGILCDDNFGVVRLAGGSGPHEGRVEVLALGTWGTVCDDSWTLPSAMVLCRQLGYTSALTVLSRAYFGQGGGQVHLDNVECTGFEDRLVDCPHGGIGKSNCRHDEDAGVVCNVVDVPIEDIRLAGSVAPYEGVVEILALGVWGTVCDEDWDIADATVACRQLGFLTAKDVPSSALYGRASGEILVDDVTCSGGENHLSECPLGLIGSPDCSHGKDAAVVCSNLPNRDLFENCFDEHFCKSSCNDRIPSFVRLIRRNACRCDKMCTVYGDCCQDYSENCPPYEEEVDLGLHRYTSCISQPFSDSLSNSYIAVSMCPPWWPHDEVRDLCENETRSQTQRFLTNHLSGPQDYVFKNIFCALCHDFQYDDLVPWDTEVIACEGFSADAIHEFNASRCKFFSPVIPENLIDPHLCFPDMYSTCPPIEGFASEQERLESDLCQSSDTARIFDKPDADVLTFRNIHCYKCNVNASARYCNSCSCSKRSFGSSFFTFSKVSIKFAFNQVGGHTSAVEIRGPWGGGSSAQLGNCSKESIYDPFGDVCWKLPAKAAVFPGRGTSYPTPYPMMTRKDCVQSFLSALEEKTEFVVLESDQLLEGIDEGNVIFEGSCNVSAVLLLLVDLEIAQDLHRSLNALLTESLDGDGDLPCSFPRLVIMASSVSLRQGHQMPTCHGYLQRDVDLQNITTSEAWFNVRIGDSVYTPTHLIHMSVFGLQGCGTRRLLDQSEHVKLCYPSLNEKSCHRVDLFHQDEFEVLRSSDESLKRRGTGEMIRSGEYLRLPNQTIAACVSELVSIRRSGTLHALRIIGGTISLVSVTATAVLYSSLPSLQSLPAGCVRQLSLAVGISHLALFKEQISPPWLCCLRAYTLHVSWLSLGTWLTVLTAHILYKVKVLNGAPRYANPRGAGLLKMYLYAWGLPIICASVGFLISQLMSLRYEGGMRCHGDCWIGNLLHSLLLFGLPATLMFLLDASMLACTARLVLSQPRMGENVEGEVPEQAWRRNTCSDLLLCVQICGWTGASWMLFLLTTWSSSQLLGYISAVLTSFQGLFLSLNFFFKKNVRNAWIPKILSISLRLRNQVHPVQT